MFLKLPSLSVAIGKALGPSSRPCNNNNSNMRSTCVGNLCTTIAIDSLDSFDSVAVVTVAVASTIGKAIATAAMR
jgi:hypothetical protein